MVSEDSTQKVIKVTRTWVVEVPIDARGNWSAVAVENAIDEMEGAPIATYENFSFENLNSKDRYALGLYRQYRDREKS